MTRELRPLGARLVAVGWVDLGLAALAVLVLVVMDWVPAHLLAGTAVGVVVWGVFEYLFEVRRTVPGRDDLPAAPADARLVVAYRPGRLWLVCVVPVTVFLAWLAHGLDVGGALVPGQWLGFAVANLAGALVVRRWEAARGGRVLQAAPRRGEAPLFVER